MKAERYHASNFGMFQSRELNVDLDGYVPLNAAGVREGRWEYPDDWLEDDDEVDRVVQENIRLTEEMNARVDEWRANG